MVGEGGHRLHLPSTILVPVFLFHGERVEDGLVCEGDQPVHLSITLLMYVFLFQGERV